MENALPKKYRHYNSKGKGYDYKRFCSEKFVPIENSRMFTKPKYGTGYWASPIECARGWVDWCMIEEPTWIDLSNYYDFTLSDDANVLYLEKKQDLLKLSQTHPSWIAAETYYFEGALDDYFSMVYLDFEQMMANGIDAIEVRIDELYYKLNGWDCDSLLVMNPQIVEMR